jgi:uncharacterized protein YcbK (DUF882 family)
LIYLRKKQPSGRGLLPLACGFVSALALSSCVSSAVDIGAYDSLSRPDPAIAVAQTKGNGETVPELQFKDQQAAAAPDQTASAADPGNNSQQTPTQGQITIDAARGSIFATQPPRVEEVIAASESGTTVPAFVPLPTVNPALASLYGSKAVQPEPNKLVDVTRAVAAAPADPVHKGDRVAHGQNVQVASLFSAQPENPVKQFNESRFEPAPEKVVNPVITVPDDGKPHAKLNAFFPPKPEAANADAEDDEDDDGPVGLMRLVSAPSMARVAPNGIWIQTENVETDCFRPNLVSLLHKVEKHFGKPPIVTSGFRPVAYNKAAGGASHSKHTTCDAADIQVNGVSKWELADFVRSLPERGGVGTYCYTKSVHIDTGSARDWNWRCRRHKR